MRQLIVIGCASLLIGCASSTNNNYTQTVQSWRGGNVSNLIARWGTPNDQAVGPRGNTAYVYTTTSYQSYQAPTNPSIGVHYTAQGAPVITNTGSAVMNMDRAGLSLNCTAIFIADGTGKIIDTKIQGAGCYGGTDFSSRMGNPANPKPATQGSNHS